MHLLVFYSPYENAWSKLQNYNLFSAQKQDDETQVCTIPRRHFSRPTGICYGDAQYLWVFGVFNFDVLACIILRWLLKFLKKSPLKNITHISVCSLFNNAVSNLRYVPLTIGFQFKNPYKIITEEEVLVCLNFSRHSGKSLRPKRG
jgi:hypothetical protein